MPGCACLFQELAAAHVGVREAEANLDTGKQVIHTASKQISKIRKNPAAANILRRNEEILDKEAEASRQGASIQIIQILSTYRLAGFG